MTTRKGAGGTPFLRLQKWLGSFWRKPATNAGSRRSGALLAPLALSGGQDSGEAPVIDDLGTPTLSPHLVEKCWANLLREAKRLDTVGRTAIGCDLQQVQVLGAGNGDAVSGVLVHRNHAPDKLTWRTLFSPSYINLRIKYFWSGATPQCVLIPTGWEIRSLARWCREAPLHLFPFGRRLRALPKPITTCVHATKRRWTATFKARTGMLSNVIPISGPETEEWG